MRTLRGSLLLVLALAPVLVAAIPHHLLAAPGGLIEVLGRDGSTLDRITDGDTVSLRVSLPEKA
ncbi:MAG: hypothetical protein MUO35_13325, partial [Anaerolineales bacterium]|nr:hypothetical protein [Anaerolineales bacterium]